MTDGEKERIKLRANWLNGISIAMFAVGTLTSTIRLFADTSVSTRMASVLAALAAGCLAVSFALHLLPQRVLRRLDE